MKPIKHVIFVIVDSVRSYKTGVDDRDRLDFMDEFKKETEFLASMARLVKFSLLQTAH